METNQVHNNEQEDEGQIQIEEQKEQVSEENFPKYQVKWICQFCNRDNIDNVILCRNCNKLRKKPYGQCIIIPGNGCDGDITEANWYYQLQQDFQDSKGKFGQIFDKSILKNMPDPIHAREKIWIPFILKLVGSDNLNDPMHFQGPSNTVIVGHSSGAVCALRILEQHPENQQPYAGCVLVSACHTDLGDEHEAFSGYYNRKWNWEKIKRSSQWIIQFHGTDDPFIPLKESRHIAKQLKLKNDYHEIKYGSHFFDYFEQLPNFIMRKAKQFQAANDILNMQQYTKTEGKYVCSLCLNNIKKCVLLTPCHHYFCSECIFKSNEKLSACPECDTPIQKIRKNSAITKLAAYSGVKK